MTAAACLRLCGSLLVGGFAIFGEPLSFGIEAGVPLTNALASAGAAYRAQTQRYTIGPAVELALAGGLAVEAGLLFKRLEYGAAQGVAASANRWELPLVLKYCFPGRPIRPVAGAGVSWNHVSGIGGGAARNLAELRHRGTWGFVAEGGFEVPLGRCRLSPVVRATHWVDRNFGTRDSAIRSNLTQVELLVGIYFR